MPPARVSGKVKFPLVVSMPSMEPGLKFPLLAANRVPTSSLAPEFHCPVPPTDTASVAPLATETLPATL